MKHLAGIIGSPVAHSLSPVFQQAAFGACGLDAEYQRWETTPAVLPARVASLREARCLGANVTIPYKEQVIPLIDELGGQSARVGAVNTIVNRGGRLFGFNTDGPGFIAALRDEASFDVAGTDVLLSGAGGAARGIAFALAEAGAARIAIWNRTASRAARLAADVAAEARGEVVSLPAPPSEARYDLVVQTTSIGMEGGPDPTGVAAGLDGARQSALAVDIVYAPEDTPFLQAARRRGLRTLGGLPMLIHQGALAFELFTGVHAPLEVMFDAARQELARRSAGAAR
jgi:shikimate dehydrogenase